MSRFCEVETKQGAAGLAEFLVSGAGAKSPIIDKDDGAVGYFEANVIYVSPVDSKGRCVGSQRCEDLIEIQRIECLRPLGRDVSGGYSKDLRWVDGGG